MLKSCRREACAKPFEGDLRTAYCSHACSMTAQKERERLRCAERKQDRLAAMRTCALEGCEAQFRGRGPKKYCSPECSAAAERAYLRDYYQRQAAEARKGRPDPMCARSGCGASFKRVSKKRFCSEACRRQDERETREARPAREKAPVVKTIACAGCRHGEHDKRAWADWACGVWAQQSCKPTEHGGRHFQPRELTA